MQESPPDILITNYSMLNIMLMRDIESSIFDKTRIWLEADPAHIFHLVVDELHTYRGTPGTEVGYILRVLYERLGLHPDHPQLRILASSASLGDDEAQAQDYLSQFFGRSRHFDLIRGSAVELPAGASGRLRNLAAPLTELGREVATNQGAGMAASIDTFCAAAGLRHPDERLAPEQRLGAALAEAGAPDAVRLGAASGSPKFSVRGGRLDDAEAPAAYSFADDVSDQIPGHASGSPDPGRSACARSSLPKPCSGSSRQARSR